MLKGKLIPISPFTFNRNIYISIGTRQWFRNYKLLLLLLLFPLQPYEPERWKSDLILWNRLKFRRPNLFFRPNKHLVVFLQLRCAAKKTIPRTPNFFFFASMNQPRYELRHDLDQNPTIGTFDILKRALPELDWSRFRARVEGGKRRSWQDIACKAIERKNEVSLAWHEIIVYG